MTLGDLFRILEPLSVGLSRILRLFVFTFFLALDLAMRANLATMYCVMAMKLSNGVLP